MESPHKALGYKIKRREGHMLPACMKRFSSKSSSETTTNTVSIDNSPSIWDLHEFAHGTCHKPHKGHLVHRKMQWQNEIQRFWMKIQGAAEENLHDQDAVVHRQIVEVLLESLVA